MCTKLSDKRCSFQFSTIRIPYPNTNIPSISFTLHLEYIYEQSIMLPICPRNSKNAINQMIIYVIYKAEKRKY